MYGTMTNQPPHSFETVHRLADIPHFQSEDEEHEFWSTHEFGEELLTAAQPLARGILPLPRGRTRISAVRFDESTLKRVRDLAARRHQGYQTLIKQFVTERLDEEEKRDGTVGQ
jgi:predicted DNA binding CopG/RHH family protein